jgi:hypothetical protein
LIRAEYFLMRHTYKTYKITYDVNLKARPGSFCTSPLDIMMQMNDAQHKTLKDIRQFIRDQNLGREVTSLKPVPNQIGLMITCSDEAAKKIARLPCVRKMEKLGDDQRPKPPPAVAF